MSDDRQSNYLEDLLRELTAHEVDFVVAGGVAVVLHGIERTTMDLDISLEMSAANVERFKGAMESQGLRPLVPVPVESLSDPETVRVMVEEKHAIVFMLADPEMPLRKVDVFLTKELSYERLVEDAVVLDIPGMPLKVVSPERLLELKRAIEPQREKDIFDIRALEKLIEGASG